MLNYKYLIGRNVIMKKRTKTLIAGLVAVPMAILAGCNPPAVVKPFADNQTGFDNRTYSQETTIAETNSFGDVITAPTTTAGKVEQSYTSANGTKTIVMSGVTQAEYETYEAQVETASVSTVGGTYSVTFDGVTGTMTIVYTPAGDLDPEAGIPTSFRTLNLLNSASQSLYMKLVMDFDKIYGNYTKEEHAEYIRVENPGITAEEIDTMWEEYLENLTTVEHTPTGKLAVEMGYRINGSTQDVGTTVCFEDTNFMKLLLSMDPSLETMAAMYSNTFNASVRTTTIGTSTYTTMYMPKESMVIPGAEDIKQYMVQEGPAVETFPTGDVTGNLDGALGIVKQTYAELKADFFATGYELVNGNSYYYEEFNLSADPAAGTMRFYFNGNDLIYIGSVVEGETQVMEVLISNNVPEYLFDTRVPNGYVDITQEASAIMAD